MKLKALTAALCLLCSGAYAQGHPTYPDRVMDTLEVSTEGYTAKVVYYNSHSKTSRMVSEKHTVGELTFSVEVVVGIGEPETLIIRTISPGYKVVPEEVQLVEDGQEVTVYIIPVTG